MTFQYCENCQKKTGHKRAIGAGTVIGAFATGGFSLLATPFYPLRCIACGDKGDTISPEDKEPESNQRLLIFLMIIGAFMLLGALVK